MAKFLLVDDDHEILKVSCMFLKQLGHECTTADNALEAIELLNNHSFEVLISDATMPQFSGFDLLRALKKNSKHDKLIKIMLTGRRDAEDVQQAAKLGVTDYIVKPIDPNSFIEKIARALKQIPESISNSSPHVNIEQNWSYQINFEIKKLSEFGLGLRASNPLPVGFEIPFRIDQALNGIFIPSTLLRIIHCEKDGDNFFINTVFVDLNEKQRINIFNAIQQRRNAA